MLREVCVVVSVAMFVNENPYCGKYALAAMLPYLVKMQYFANV